jgi:hypothetical protein
VNQNFTDVKTAVDDNDSRISANETAISNNASTISSNTTAIGVIRQGLSVYDNGVRIGALVALDEYSYISMLSDNGYIYKYYPSILVNNLVFTSTDCTGQAHITFVTDKITNDYIQPIYSNGYVINTTNTGFETMYTLPNSPILDQMVYSTLTNDSCTTLSPTTTSAIKAVYVNDTNITGISNSITGPITIGY